MWIRVKYIQPWWLRGKRTTMFTQVVTYMNLRWIQSRLGHKIWSLTHPLLMSTDVSYIRQYEEWTELRDMSEKTRMYEDGPNFRDLYKILEC